MYIYSGKVREGVCGTPTPLKDFAGEPLFVGDIVMTSTVDKQGICNNCGLTVVVSTEFTSYSNGEHIKNDNPKFFVMGIKNVDFMGKDSEEWIVKKMKSFEDVVDGEHWKDYGFNYSIN